MVDANAMAMFYKEPEEGELNLVTLVAEHLNSYEESIEGDVFKQSSDIIHASKLNMLAQRVVINRYLFNKLLIYRSMTDIEVVNTVQFLANDGLTEDWITLMKEFVIPFVVHNKVLSTVN